MSRNSSRSIKPPVPPEIEQQIQPVPPPQMEFPIPTEFVDLPSEGVLYPPSHPWYGQLRVEIKHMTAKEEDVLSSQSYITKGVVLDKFLQSILLHPVDPDSLLLVDRTAILIAARVTGYGDIYNTVVTCNECRLQNEAAFSTNDSIKEGEFDSELLDNGLHEVQFDDLNVEVKIRSLTVADQAYLEKTAEMRTKNGLPENTITSLLRSMIATVNGSSDPATISKFVDSLSAKHSMRIRSSYKIVMPTLALEYDFTCTRCGYTTGLEVPLNADFFWPR